MAVRPQFELDFVLDEGGSEPLAEVIF